MALKQGMGNFLNYFVLNCLTPDEIASGLDQHLSQASVKYKREIGTNHIRKKDQRGRSPAGISVEVSFEGSPDNAKEPILLV